MKPNNLQTTDSSEVTSSEVVSSKVVSSEVASYDLTRYSYKIDHRDSLKCIQKQLTDSLALILSTQNYRKVIVKNKPLKSLDSLYLVIHEISIAVFQLYTKRQDYKVFIISLYKINWLLNDIYAYKAIPDPMKEQMLA